MSDAGAGGEGGFPGQGGPSRIALAWELQGAEAARTATEARLRGIRAVLTTLEADVGRGLPSVVPGWHSPAAAAYAEQLHGLHAELAGILATVQAAETSAWRELAGWQGECDRLSVLLRRAMEGAGV